MTEDIIIIENHLKFRLKKLSQFLSVFKAFIVDLRKYVCVFTIVRYLIISFWIRLADH